MRNHPLNYPGVKLAPSLNAVDSYLSYACYADDIDAPFFDVNLAVAWLKVADMFEKVSGLGLSMSKTEVNLVGSAFSSVAGVPSQAADAAIALIKAGFPQIGASNFKIGADHKYLGITFSILKHRQANRDPGSLTDSSWTSRAAKLIPLLGFYASCPLRSWRDRLIFAQSHLLSRIQFLAFACPCPLPALALLQSALNSFVFRDASAPISIKIASTPPSMTGISHVNLSMRFKSFAISIFVQYLKGTLPPNLHALVN